MTDRFLRTTERELMNPWLEIPPSDYEGHMSHISVRQLQVLNSILKNTLERYAPRSLAVLGCATGNGLEHIEPTVTQKVYALDINDRYLEVVQSRYGYMPGLRLIHGDVRVVELPRNALEHIHAGLLFEYVEPAFVLLRIASWLRAGGVLSVVLQASSGESKTRKVSNSPFKSLMALDSVIQLVDPKDFQAMAADAGLNVIETFRHNLVGNKRFECFYLERPRLQARR